MKILKYLDYIPFLSTFNGAVRLAEWSGLTGIKGRVHQIAKRELDVDKYSSDLGRLGRAVVTLIPGINLLTIPYDLFFRIFVDSDPFSSAKLNKMDEMTRRFAEGIKQWREDPAVKGNKKRAASQLLKTYQEKIKTLDLTEYGLNSLPLEIGELTFLENLRLPCNKLREVSLEVGKLVRLRCLSLSFNKIEGLLE